MKKKVAIAIVGPGNTGKSATLRKVYDHLKAEYPKAVPKIKEEVNNGDVLAIIEIEGLKVGIESQGDPGSRLLKSLEMFVSLQCEIIVCAARKNINKTKQYRAVMTLENSQYEII